VTTTHALNVQADEVYDPVLTRSIRRDWRKWVADGYEVFSFKLLHTEHNAQQFQGGELWDGDYTSDVWHRAGYHDPTTRKGGAGYRISYKMVEVGDQARFLHDAWSFDWRGMKTKNVHFSERHPIIHLHDFHRDSFVAIRKNAANDIWQDRSKYEGYHSVAERTESTQASWWRDPIWTRRQSPFAPLMPDYARLLVGRTKYSVDWRLVQRHGDCGPVNRLARLLRKLF
jgi:hypothetical protein